MLRLVTAADSEFRQPDGLLKMRNPKEKRPGFVPPGRCHPENANKPAAENRNQ
jgi:hypothetical protein